MEGGKRGESGSILYRRFFWFACVKLRTRAEVKITLPCLQTTLPPAKIHKDLGVNSVKRIAWEFFPAFHVWFSRHRGWLAKGSAVH